MLVVVLRHGMCFGRDLVLLGRVVVVVMVGFFWARRVLRLETRFGGRFLRLGSGVDVRE